MFHVFRMCSFGQNVQQPIYSFMWERGSVLDKGLKTAHRKKNCKLVKKKFSLLASFEMYRVQHGGNAKWSYGVRVPEISVLKPRSYPRLLTFWRNVYQCHHHRCCKASLSVLLLLWLWKNRTWERTSHTVHTSSMKLKRKRGVQDYRHTRLTK